ncbi:MAG: hypothetical protein IT392_02300 [Nitrospirae bacterium]|nr:hypothetical protein [Nitrospirota bacterium]
MNSLFKLFLIITIGLSLPSLLLPISYTFAGCTPVVKIISSVPADRSKGIDPSAPIIITWDKTADNLAGGTYDYKPMLESLNIAGGRYLLGVLLTTEWGAGGKVVWDGNKETVTPEAPLEPGTQYKIWTYTYTSGAEACPATGGELVFVTAGEPPQDNNPVRKIDISTIYHGNELGAGRIEGDITAINDELNIVTVKESFMKSINVILYDGLMAMRNGSLAQPSNLKVGDKITGDFMGGRLYMITATGRSNE